jgi:hypothetical protein
MARDLRVDWIDSGSRRDSGVAEAGVARDMTILPGKHYG